MQRGLKAGRVTKFRGLVIGAATGTIDRKKAPPVQLLRSSICDQNDRASLDLIR